MIRATASPWKPLVGTSVGPIANHATVGLNESVVHLNRRHGIWVECLTITHQKLETLTVNLAAIPSSPLTAPVFHFDGCPK